MSGMHFKCNDQDAKPAVEVARNAAKRDERLNRGMNTVNCDTI